MAKRGLSSADGEGFLRAFTDLWADICSIHEVRLAMGIEPTKRKGVITIRLSAWDAGSAPDSPPRATYGVEYPTAAIASLEAWLYSSLNKLDRMLLDTERYPAGRA